MRFTLRTLFIGITLVAVALMCWLGYRQATLCRLQRLSPASPAAKALFPTPVIRKLDGGSYTFTYYARSRDIQSLLSVLPPSGSRELVINRQSIVCESPDQATVQACLWALQWGRQTHAGIVRHPRQARRPQRQTRRPRDD